MKYIQHFANHAATIYLDALLLDGIALPDDSVVVSYLASWYTGSLDAKLEGMIFQGPHAGPIRLLSPLQWLLSCRQIAWRAKGSDDVQQKS